MLGSGCVSVGRVVASNTRSPWFKCTHRQFLFTIKCIRNAIKRRVNKEKEARNGKMKNSAMVSSTYNHVIIVS